MLVNEHIVDANDNVNLTSGSIYSVVEVSSEDYKIVNNAVKKFELYREQNELNPTKI